MRTPLVVCLMVLAVLVVSCSSDSTTGIVAPENGLSQTVAFTMPVKAAGVLTDPDIALLTGTVAYRFEYSDELLPVEQRFRTLSLDFRGTLTGESVMAVCAINCCSCDRVCAAGGDNAMLCKKYAVPSLGSDVVLKINYAINGTAVTLNRAWLERTE